VREHHGLSPRRGDPDLDGSVRGDEHVVAFGPPPNDRGVAGYLTTGIPLWWIQPTVFLPIRRIIRDAGEFVLDIVQRALEQLERFGSI